MTPICSAAMELESGVGVGPGFLGGKEVDEGWGQNQDKGGK